MSLENPLYMVNEAAAYIGSRIRQGIDTAVVLGSGLGELGDEMEERIVIDYKDIPNFPVSTVKGHAGKLISGRLGSANLIAMQGRFHFYEGYKMPDVVFPIRVMKTLGIKRLLLTNAAGGINTTFVPGDLMVIKDHINLSMENPLIGKNFDELGPRFPDMSETYSTGLIEKLKASYKKNNIRFLSGTYVSLTGPNYETPAEIRMLRFLGADAVGMSTVPEAIAAKHCGIEVAGISCITNMAAGILNKPLNHEEVMETSNMVKDKFKAVVKDFLNNL